MEVKLVYFKQSGKFYSQGTYQTEPKDMFLIWREVRLMRDQGLLPELVNGAKEFNILVDVPEHPYNHPHLVMLETDDTQK